MLGTHAVVRAIRAGYVTAEPDVRAGCGDCAQRKCCDDTIFNVGDRVFLGVEESALLRASFRAYVLPLLFLFGGAATAGLGTTTRYAPIMKCLARLGGQFQRKRARVCASR